MSVKVQASTHPLRDEWVYADVDDGQTIREIVGEAPVHAWINGREVPAELLGRTRPRAGTTLIIRPVPQDGDVWRTVAQVAVVVVSAIATVVTYGAYGAVWGAVAGAVVSAGGTLLVNQFIPPQLPSLDAGGDSFNRLAAFTGQSNRVAAFKSIPCLYGQFRFFPPIPMTAQPFTELVGSDQYLRMRLVLGYGPMEIGGQQAGGGSTITESTSLTGTPIKIGDTDIALYDNVEFIIGDPDDVSLYSDQVVETNPAWTTEADVSGIDNDASGQWITDGDTATRTTDTDADEISIDITANAGLFSINSKGSTTLAKIDFKVEYRTTGGGAYTTLIDPWTVTSTKKETFRAGKRWSVSRGQYDVKITRKRTYHDDFEAVSDQTTWTALRTIRHVDPFNVDDTVVMDLRIRATDQLQGRLENVNVEATRMIPVYNGSSWVTQTTRVPAWIYADILTGVANGDPIAKSDLDTDELESWATETNSDGRYYDGVFDSNGTVFDRAQEVASTGRASFAINDSAKISVVRDVTQASPKMVISPRNSFGFSSTLALPKTPHAYRVRFIDPDTYEDTERLVYDDGFTSANATTFEVLQTKGVKDADQAWKDGRYHLAQQRLRPETFTFSQDVQHLRFRRGDRLALNQDVILVGLGAGRVTAITTDGNGDVTAFDCDEKLYMESGTDYGVKVQLDDGSIVTEGITTVTTYTTSVTLDSPVTGIQVGDHFVFGESGSETIDVKVTDIQPRQDFIAQISAVPYAGNILDAETGTIPTYDPVLTSPIDINKLPPPIPEIYKVRSDESAMYRDIDGSYILRLMVFLRTDTFPGTHTQMEVRIRNQNESDAGWNVSEPKDAGLGVFTFRDVIEGDTYDIQARSTRESKNSQWSPTTTHTIVGKTAKPPDVTNFFVSTEADGTRKYTWDTSNQPFDVAGYVIKYVRGSSWTSWASATRLQNGLIPTSPWESNLLPAGDFVLAIKAEDTSENQSENETTLQVTLGDPRLANVIAHKVPSVEDWPGTLTDCHVNAENQLEADTTGGWSGLPSTWSALGDTWTSMGTTEDPISYVTEEIDLGRDVTFTPRVTTEVEGTATVTMKTGTEADGGVTGSFVSTAKTTGRYIQIKVSVTNPTSVAVIEFMEVLIDSPTVIINHDDVDTSTESASWFESIAAGHFKVATQNNMAAISSATIRAFQDVGSGWTFELLDKAATISGNSNPAAEFKMYNSSGTLADATVDIEIKGQKA